MGGNYEKGLFNQLMDVMARLEAVDQKYEDRILKMEQAHEAQMARAREESGERIHRLEERVGVLEKENAQLKEGNRLLTDENARLKSMMDNDSSNTSLPPSTDQKPAAKRANEYNGRRGTKRRAGAQAGHRGSTLTARAAREMISAGRCRHVVREIGDVESARHASRYVVDLEVGLRVTEVRIHAGADGKLRIPEEYRSAVTYGPNVKAMAVDLYSEGVVSNDRIAAFINAMSGGGLHLSEGSVYGFCREFSRRASATVEALEERLLGEEVVMTDATTSTVGGAQRYVRNFSVRDTVVYRAMRGKSLSALGGLCFLARFAGCLVHDHETALYHFGTRHGECNVHLLRYLRKNTQDTGNGWSRRMASFLCSMNRARKKAMERGEGAFSAEALIRYEARYAQIIGEGRTENRKTRHRYAKRDERALLNRLEKYMANHLLFLHDFAVPFDDNMSERDLRKVKNREKMAGGFRKASGQEMYCNILTIVETLKRRRMQLFENIRLFFMGTPVSL